MCDISLKIHLSIRSSISKVWDDCSDIFGWSSSASIYHYEKFHKIFICWRAGWLDQVYITATDTLLQLNINLSICKSLNPDTSKVEAHILSNFLSEKQSIKFSEEVVQWIQKEEHNKKRNYNSCINKQSSSIKCCVTLFPRFISSPSLLHPIKPPENLSMHSNLQNKLTALKSQGT